MKRAIVASICGLGCSAQAASVTLLFSASAADGVRPGEAVTWTVSAFTTGLSDTGYFGGFVGSFIASEPGIGEVTNIQSFMAGQGIAARGEGASVVDINIFHSALLGTDDPTNPLAIFSFDVVLGDNSYGVPLRYDAEGVATLFDSAFIFEPAIEITDIAVVSDTYFWIPAGGTGTLLLAGCAIAGRRRRTDR